jgi:hypothetical protein
MAFKNTGLVREELAYAMVRAPHFNPERGDTQAEVLRKLRGHISAMQNEWWGGEELYRRMGEYIDQAEAQLNAGNVVEAKRAFGEVYAIIDQTPRPKKGKPSQG